MNLFKQHKYFGQPLNQIQKRKTGQCDKRIPSLVYLCVMYLSEPEHVCMEGLFRKAAQQSEIDKVKKIIDQKSCLGQKSLLIKIFDKDIAICASILKKFLNELPNAIISNNQVQLFKSIASNANNAKQLFMNMDNTSSDLFVFMLIFLNYMTKFSEKNKMNAENLAICFSPVFVKITSDLSFDIHGISATLGKMIENPSRYCPKHLLETFSIPFQHFFNLQRQQQEQNEKIKRNERINLNPVINNEQDIFDYLSRDRQMFQRSNEWKDMTYSQLVQEYEALKVATSYYFYNQYFIHETWPEDASFQMVMNKIQELKEMIQSKDKFMHPDCLKSYNMNSVQIDPVGFPKTTREFASFVADIQTEIMTIQQRIEQLPDPISLKRNGDIHTFSERKCLIAKQRHCIRINELIKANIKEILLNLKD